MSRQRNVTYRGPPVLGAVLIQMLEEELGVEVEGTEAPHEHEAPADQGEVVVQLSVAGARSTVETAAQHFSRDHPGTHVGIDDDRAG